MTRAAARLSRAPLMLLSLLMLAACSGVLPDGGERPDTYRVTAPQVSAAGSATGATLVVDEPSAMPGLATDRIAVWRDPRHLQYYADSRWVADAPEMLRGVMIEAFRSSGALQAVGRRSVELNPTHRLRTRLTAFEAGYEDGAALPTVRVELAADLLSEPGRGIIGQHTASARVTPDGESVGQVIAAFDTATQRAMTDLVRWAVDTMGRDTGGAGA